MTRIFSQYLLCERGNIMVETAIALPMLVFLFFGGFDLTRYIYLIHKSDQAAALAADTIARMQLRNISIDLNQLLMQTQENLALGSYRPVMKIGAKVVSLRPNGETHSVLESFVGDMTIGCSGAGLLPNYSIEDADPTAPRQTLVSVQICIQATNDFYTSTFLPLQSIILTSVSFRSVPSIGMWNEA